MLLNHQHEVLHAYLFFYHLNNNINNNNYINKTIIYKNGKYIGETKNGLKEGKGIYYWNNGE